MILMAARIVKIAVVLAALGAGYWLLQKRLNRKQMLYLGLLCGAFAVPANVLSGMLQPIKDVIILTAQGEARTEAKGQEVFLEGFTVDGTEYNCLDDVDIEDGHWFWCADAYCWRPETDMRQPDGVTRTVELGIPVGWNRTLEFLANEYKGYVQIQTCGKTWTIDTYSETGGQIRENVGRSATSALILNQIRILAAYVFVYVSLLFVALWAVLRAIKNPDAASKWLKQHDAKFIYGTIAVCTFVFMLLYADKASLWIDEIGAISFTHGSVMNAVRYCLNVQEYHPPLFDIIATFWYHIAPYGERWLLLVSIIPSVLSIYVIGLIGEQIKDKYLGCLAALFCATSIGMWTRQAYEYRPYAMILLFFSLTVYCYIRRNQNAGAVKWRVLYGASLLCLGMTDYFGMVACAEFFVSDVYLLAKRRLNWRSGLDYVVPGAVCLGWIAMILHYMAHAGRTYTGWGMPTLESVRSVMQILSGNVELMYWLLLFGIALGVIKKLTRKEICFAWGDHYCAVFAWMIVLTISAPIIIAKLTGMPEALWMDRYFLFLTPCACVLMGNAVMFLAGLGRESDRLLKPVLVVFFAGFLSINCLISASKLQTSEPYREAADWIYQQVGYIFNDNTVIMSVDGGIVDEAWQEYYITRQGKRDPLKLCQDTSELLQYDRIYIPYCHSRNVMRGRKQEILNTIQNDYVLETDNQQVAVMVYVRK